MLTVKQIADKARVSKMTVSRYMKRIEESTGSDYMKHNTETKDGVIYISDDLAEQITEAIAKKKTPPQTVTDRNSDKVQTTTDCNSDVQHNATTPSQITTECNSDVPQTATDCNNSEKAALNRIIEVLQAQNEQLQQDKADLREQLAIKDKQIEQLNILLSQQQQLQQTLQVKLLETETEQDETVVEEPKKKKGLFGLFKKKEN